MAFKDRIKKALQQEKKEVQAPPTTAESFKQFLATKQQSEPKIFNNATNWMMNSAINQRNANRVARQTATQNVRNAERTVQPVASTKSDLTGNTTVRQNTQVSDEDLKKMFKQYNPNATDVELDTYVRNAKANGGNTQLMAQATVNSNANNTTKNTVLEATKQNALAETPQLAQEKPYETGEKFVRNKKTGEVELKSTVLKEPQVITDLKKAFSQENAKGWNLFNASSMLYKTVTGGAEAVGETAKDTGVSVLKGIAGMGEGIDDFKSYAYAQMVDWASNLTKNEKGKDDLKSYAKDIREEASKSGEWLTNIQEWQDDANKNSALGKKGEQAGEAIGSSIPTMALDVASGGLGKVGQVLSKSGLVGMAISSAGNSLTESYQKRGKLDALAWAKAGVDGVTTYGTEEASGLLGRGVTWDNKLATNLNKYIDNSVAKTLVRLNISSMAEGTEEIEEYFANKVTNSLMNTILNFTGDNGARYEGVDSIDMAEAVDNYVMGYISSFLTQGATKIGQIGINSRGSNIKQTIDQMSAQEEANAQKEIEETNLKNTEKRLEKAIKKEKSPDLINYLTEQLNAVKGQIESLNAPAQISEQFKQVLQGRNAQDVIQENMSLSEQVAGPVQRAVDLVNDTLESTVEKNAQYFKSDADRNKFLNYGKGIQAITKQAGNPVKVLLDTTVGGDGLITINNADGTRAILVNPSMSNQSMEETLVHELFHNVKNTDEFKQIGETLDNFVKKFKIKDSQGNLITLENAKKQLQERYENYYKQHGLDTSTLDIDEESHAFLLQKIIGDEKTLNNLTRTQPKIVQAIYDFVDRIGMRLKGLDKETAKTIIDLRNKLGNALKNNGIEVADTMKKYAINGDGRDFFYRGQEKEGQELSYNSTRFQGSEDEGYYFTPNKKTANKYGKNIIERFRDENNTVTVEESDRLQKMATEKLNEHMKEGTWTEEDDLLEQMALGRSKAFAEYTGKPFVETGDMFGEDAEAVYYPEFDKDANYTIEETNKQASKQDNQGRTLSKEQQEFFKDSKVRDENGNLLEVYHGTKTDGINIFEYNPNKQTGTDYGKAFYFTSDYTKAQGYQYDIENDPAYKEYSKKDEEYKNWVFEKDISEEERSKRIKEWSNWHEKNSVFDILNNENFTPERLPKGETKKVYLNLTNPYIADAKGEYYFNVYDKYFKEAKENGNDGIIVKNVIDVARGEHKPIDVYIAFNENQIKNVDNTNPTSNPDIRYSISENTPTQDNQGRELSKGQQEYFKNSKVKDNKGNLVTVYHGTNNAGFTTFNRTYNYYSDNKNVAQSYTGGNEMVDTRKLESISDAKSWLKGITDEAYIEGTTLYDEYGEELLSYENEQELLRNLKQDIINEIGNSEAGGTYEGYLNITNPIEIDAGGKMWSKIPVESIKIDNINIQELFNKYGSDTWVENGETVTATNDIVDAIYQAIEDGDIEADGVIIKNVLDEGGYGKVLNPEEAGTDYITFNSNQFKAKDNLNPTSDQDIRYSQNTKNNNIWNNFLDQVDKQTGEKNRTYFKQGETKAKLPVNAKYSVSTDDYKQQANDLIDKANIPDKDKTSFKDSIKNIEITEQMIPELKDTLKIMEENAKADYDAILDTNRKYSDADEIRKKTYQKYKRQTKAYDNSSLQNAMNIIQPNYQGRRTKEQWLQIASQIGTEIAEKNNNEIEQIAFRSFIEAQPNQKENLNRQGNKYVGFNSDDWVNTVYNAVKEQRAKPKVEKKVAPVKKEAKAPVKETIANEYLKFREASEKVKNKQITDDEFFSIPYYDNLIKQLQDTGMNKEQALLTWESLGNLEGKDLTTKNINNIIKLNKFTDSQERENFRAELMRERAGIPSKENTNKTTPEAKAPVQNNLTKMSDNELHDLSLNNYNEMKNKGYVTDENIDGIVRTSLNDKGKSSKEGQQLWNRHVQIQQEFRKRADATAEKIRESRQQEAPVKEQVQQAEEFTERNAQDFDALMSEIDQQPKLPTKKVEQTTEQTTLVEEDNKKERRTYKSILESDYQTEEAKKIAKEQLGTDKYTPDSNKSQIDRADAYIEREGIDKAYDRLMSNMDNDTFTYDKKRLLRKSELVGVDDIALGERLMQYYSKTGDAVKLQNVIRAVALAGTEAGRSVQAMSMIRRQTPDGQALWLQRNVDRLNDELARRKGGTINRNKDGTYTITNQYGKDITTKVDLFKLTPEMLEKVTKSQTQEELLENVAEVEKELGQQVSKSTIEKLDEWRYFSMLANPKTHIRNMLGNFFMGKTQDLKNFIAGGLEDAVAIFNPKMDRTKTIKLASKEVRDYARNDLNNKEVQTMLEIGSSKYDKPSSIILDNQRTFKSKILESTLGNMFKANSKALEVEDAWGLRSAYRKALQQYMTANKLTPANITDEQLGTARRYAVQQAKEATFHQASTLATTLENLSKNNKVGKFFLDALVPFKKTPINVAKTGVAYSPVSVLRAVSTDLVALKQGKITVNQYIDNMTKGLTGSGIAVLGFALARMGLLSASGDDDKDKEYYDELQGKQPYSLKIGDKTYSLDWLAPAGIPLFIGAETYNMTQQRKREGKNVEEKTAFTKALDTFTELANSTAKALNPMAEMSMISGLTDTFSKISQAGTDEGKNLQYLEQLGVNSLSSYVNQYFPTVLGQLARTIDPYERTTVSTKSGTIPKTLDQTKNQVMAKLPGVRQLLPVKTDIWGNEVKAEENVAKKTFNNFLNPATVKKISKDSVDKGLNELFSQTGQTNILPTNFGKKITINGKNYILSGEDYQKYKKEYGQTSHEMLQSMMASEEYQSLNDTEKAQAVTKIYSYVNEKIKLDYAEKKNEEMEMSTSYKTIEELKESGATNQDIVTYMAKYDNIKADYDEEGNVISGSQKNKQTEWLLNSDISDEAKQIIYENRVGNDESYKKFKGNINTYLQFKVDTNKQKNKRTKDTSAGIKQEDKMKAIIKGDYTNKERQQLYDTIVSDDDEVYKALKKTKVNMKEYLKYKEANLKADRVDDGTVDGKAVSGSLKAKKVEYINNMNITYEQKLLLMGKDYKLSTQERSYLANYINGLKMTRKEKLDLYGSLKGFTVYKDGRVTW